MSALKNKLILIVSPQSWGKMFVSKHHYAVELAKYGNTVYFLNPPDETLPQQILITAVEGTANLFVINHKILFPYNIKFHAISIFHWLMKWQVKKILKTINRPIDIVWSFDLGNLYPFKFFPKKTIRIFHPVDEPLNKAAIDSAKDAQIIFSVTNEILEKYKQYKLPLHFINHGVSEIFFEQTFITREDAIIRVGFSGNLLRYDIDRPILLKIIKSNPTVMFECWGSYKLKDANIGGEEDKETIAFIESIKSLSNVILHGAVAVNILAKVYNLMNAFLICYDIEKDQSKGTNYHKIMEYLTNGKVIISNNVTTYKDNGGLMEMTNERNTNEKLPQLFKNVIENLHTYNSPQLQHKRIKFSQDNTYRKQIERIEIHINKLMTNN